MFILQNKLYYKKGFITEISVEQIPLANDYEKFSG